MMQPRERFLNFLQHKPVDRPPIWLMRQAGRYLPEYLATRKKASNFKNLCYDSSLACEVALQPLERFDLDASIVFADILNVLEACGIDVSFEDNIGPVIKHPVRKKQDCQHLLPVTSQLGFVLDTVGLIRKHAPNRGMIGFVGSPWTLACYAVEGKISKELIHIKKLLFQDPDTLELLINHLTEATITFAKQQIAAGCDCLVVFDSWGGNLNPELFKTWSLAYQAKLVEALKPHPVFLFTRGSTPHIENILSTNSAGVCIDWTCPLTKTLTQCQNKGILLQGNFDPSMLMASNQDIKNIIYHELDAIGCHKDYLPSLGHGLMPHLDPNKVGFFVEALKDYPWRLS